MIGKTKFKDGLNTTRPHGHYVIGNPKISLILKAVFANITTNKKVYTGAAASKSEDLIHIKDLVEMNGFTTYIDKEFSMDNIVAAHTYIEAGHKKGNLILNIMK